MAISVCNVVRALLTPIVPEKQVLAGFGVFVVGDSENEVVLLRKCWGGCWCCMGAGDFV